MEVMRKAAPITECPDCKKKFNKNIFSCRCGWFRHEEVEKKKTRDSRCDYYFAGRRCPMYGSFLEDRSCYCYGHWRNRGGSLAVAHFEYVEKNYDKIIEGANWKENLLKAHMEKNYEKIEGVKRTFNSRYFPVNYLENKMDVTKL